MPAGEGLRSPLKAQPFSGLAASTGARCGPTAASRRDLGSICSEPRYRVTLPPAAQGQPRDTTPAWAASAQSEAVRSSAEKPPL